MTVLQTFLSITPMLYISIIMLPVCLYLFLVFSKPKKTIAAATADPAGQLLEKRVDFSREFKSSVVLGATVAFGAAILIFLSGIVVDYRNSTGLFAVALPPATLPPIPTYVYPPAPILDAEGDVAGAPKTDDNTKKKKNSMFEL